MMSIDLFAVQLGIDPYKKSDQLVRGLVVYARRGPGNEPVELLFVATRFWKQNSAKAAGWQIYVGLVTVAAGDMSLQGI